MGVWENLGGSLAAVFGFTDSSVKTPIRVDDDGKLILGASDGTDIGNVDVASLPSGNLGARAKAASLCVNPATDIADAVYIGDIKFGESLPAGTALLGKVGIDQATANANEVVVKTLPSVTGTVTATAAGFGYKGADRKTMAGAAQEVTIASGTKFAHIFAEGGDIRFAVNTDATSSSAGYIIGGGAAVVHLVSATKLSVYGATGSYANVMMYG